MKRRLATAAGLAALLGGFAVACLLSPRRDRRRNRLRASVERGQDRRRDGWAMWVERRTSYADVVDEASDESFPASDPPGYVPPDRVGTPKG